MKTLPGIFALVLLLLAVAPAAATLVQSGVSFTPDPPPVPASQQQVVAQYALIPSGATTFARGHELQMQTGLADAKWTIQVTLDGRNAARQNAAGSAAFVNGEILSYSTSHDVGLTVTIDGIVPQDATTPFLVLQVEEIDNSGGIVPGSTLVVSQQVAGQPPAGPPAPVPTRTALLVAPTTPVKAPGFSGVISICGLCTALFVLMCRKT